MKVILITGASSGIGFETSIALAKQGNIVYGSVRNLDNAEELKKNGVIPIKLDVTDEKLCKNVVDTIIKNEGRIDVLINNAGYGSFGTVEDISLDEARYQFEVNVFGLASLTKNVLPYMRKNRSGRIINTSSIGGRLVSFMGAWYHASKYAVEAFSDALRMEVSDFGIDVVLIEPGGVKTGWWKIATEHLEQSAKDGAYEELAKKATKGMNKLYSNKFMSDPKVIAKAMIKAVNKKRPKTRYIVGFGGKPLLFMHWILPTRLYDYIVKNAM